MARVPDDVIHILNDAAVALYSRVSQLPETTLLLARRNSTSHEKLYQYFIYIYLMLSSLIAIMLLSVDKHFFLLTQSRDCEGITSQTALVNGRAGENKLSS